MTPAALSRAQAAAGRQSRGEPSPYLEETTRLRVRFHEVDALQIVWHGHYVQYFEEGRRAFGRRYGLDYPVFFEQRVAAPVVQLRVDYLAPARLADELEVTARLLKSEAARLEFQYEVRRAGEAALLVTGSSIQVFTTPAGELLPTWPPFMVDRLKTWEPLWTQPFNPGSARVGGEGGQTEA